MSSPYRHEFSFPHPHPSSTPSRVCFEILKFNLLSHSPPLSPLEVAFFYKLEKTKSTVFSMLLSKLQIFKTVVIAIIFLRRKSFGDLFS